MAPQIRYPPIPPDISAAYGPSSRRRTSSVQRRRRVWFCAPGRQLGVVQQAWLWRLCLARADWLPKRETGMAAGRGLPGWAGASGQELTKRLINQRERSWTEADRSFHAPGLANEEPCSPGTHVGWAHEVVVHEERAESAARRAKTCAARYSALDVRPNQILQVSRAFGFLVVCAGEGVCAGGRTEVAGVGAGQVHNIPQLDVERVVPERGARCQPPQAPAPLPTTKSRCDLIPANPCHPCCPYHTCTCCP